ncbi:MAG: hypothetical protein V8R42_06455 [Clostridia bacterium]
MKKNSIEEDITKINTYVELVLKKDYCNCNELNTILGKHCDGSKNVAYAMQHILSDYKKVLKENERYKKSDYETICLENNELREITDRIQSEYNDLLKDNFKLKNELETKRKEYQETYKDVREELKELRKENEELKNKLNLKQFDVNIVYNDYLEKLDEYERNNIPKSKLKDIIDRIDYDIKKTKEIISKNTNINASYRKNDYQIVRLRAMNTKSLDIKNRLQKLLESEE